MTLTNLKKCTCGCEYFEAVTLHRYRNEQTDIYNGQRIENPDTSIRLMKCFACEKIHMPDLGYTFMSNIEDQRLAKKIKEMVDKRNEA